MTPEASLCAETNQTDFMLRTKQPRLPLSSLIALNTDADYTPQFTAHTAADTLLEDEARGPKGPLFVSPAQGRAASVPLVTHPFCLL